MCYKPRSTDYPINNYKELITPCEISIGKQIFSVELGLFLWVLARMSKFFIVTGLQERTFVWVI